MEDMWQPEEIIQGLLKDLRADEPVWQQVLACWQESNDRAELGRKLGKRPDLEPECFPPIQGPFLVNVIAEFLEKEFGGNYSILNVQLALASANEV